MIVIQKEFVKAVVNSLNSEKSNDFVTKVYDDNLYKAIKDTILDMVVDGRYKKYYSDFEVLREALKFINEHGYLPSDKENNYAS